MGEELLTDWGSVIQASRWQRNVWLLLLLASLWNVLLRDGREPALRRAGPTVAAVAALSVQF